MAETTYLLSPEMRLLQGDAFEPRTKDKMGNPMVVKNGPNAGQPTQSYILTCGIKKDDPAAMPYLKQIATLAAKAWPRFFPNGVKEEPPMMGCVHPVFALKIQDGDGLDGDGKPNRVKEGHAGHWIVKFSQPSAPKAYQSGKYAELERLDIEANKHMRGMLKCGYYVRVNAGISSNENDTRPGMYLNPNMVEVTRAPPGSEITSGPDASTVFAGGGGPVIAHSPTVGLQMTGAYQYEALKTAGWTDEAMIAAGHATRPAPPPPAPPVSAPSAPASAHVMLPAAGRFAYEEMIAGGWTDATLISNGMMAAPVVSPVPPSGVTLPPPPGAPTPGASTIPVVPAPPGATQSPSNAPLYNGFMAPPARVMLPAAQGATYEQLKEKGWTEAQMIEHGLMRPN